MVRVFDGRKIKMFEWAQRSGLSYKNTCIVVLSMVHSHLFMKSFQIKILRKKIEELVEHRLSN